MFRVKPETMDDVEDIEVIVNDFTSDMDPDLL